MLKLVSSSKTRAKLLQKFKIDFVQLKVDFNEEQIKATNAKSFVYEAMKGKMQRAIALYGIDETPLLVADSVVTTKDGEILRKAKNKEEAKEILLKQSNNTIAIVTGVILKSVKLEMSAIFATYYEFAPFDEADLKRYLDSNEWQGKAGACMVEGFCKKYIKSVQGLESTAMGLPVERILPWLEF